MAPADDVLTSAGYLLLKAGHHIAVDFETALDSLGLSGREFLVLSNVRAADGLSQQGLSERLGLDPTLVVGLVDALEDRAFVRRSKDPADRRRNILSLTAAGIAVHDDAVAAARHAEERVPRAAVARPARRAASRVAGRDGAAAAVARRLTRAARSARGVTPASRGRRHGMRRRCSVLTAVATLAVVPLLASCGDDDDDPADPTITLFEGTSNPNVSTDVTG